MNKEVSDLCRTIAQTFEKYRDRELDGWNVDMRDYLTMSQTNYYRLIGGHCEKMSIERIVELLRKVGYTLKVVPKSMGGSIWK